MSGHSIFIAKQDHWDTLFTGAEEEDFIRIWPQNPMVEFNGSVVLNCSSSCKAISLETSLKWVQAGTGTNWKAFNLTKVDQWTARPLCFARCDRGYRKLLRANFTVYRAPEHVVLNPVPKMEIGKEYKLTCQVSGVAPIQNLTVTLFKGRKKLLVKTFENSTTTEAEDVVVPHVFTVQKEDHGEEVTCQAALDLRPEGPLFEMASHIESLDPVDFPMDPNLGTPSIIETDTEITVTCDVAGVFPAKEVKFELSYEGKSLNPEVTASRDSASARGQVSFSSEGTHKLTCTVSLGPVNRTVERSVNVYSLPEPVLHLVPSEVIAGSMVMVNCTSNGPVSPGVVMRLKNNREILPSRDLDNLFVQHEVKTHKEDDGREFVCEVQRMIDGQHVVKHTAKSLTVFYGPRMNGSSCPDRLTWKEGDMETLTCSAYGNPPPTVECKKDGTSYTIGIPIPITREHDGLVHCCATNPHGFDEKVVTIVVEFFPPNFLAIILPMVALAMVALFAVIYYKYYTTQKCGKYNLKKPQPQREAGNAAEEKRLNGDTSV
uniref:Ig-like domain-containing protein n=1 Tax=Anolis carolinensis TaxID=28377 RepID=H9G5Y5_ANOCA